MGEDHFQTAVAELEGGVFNLVVALTHAYAQDTSPEIARGKTKLYLERLITGLTPEEEESHS